MLHYPLIKVSGATYYEIGKDYGCQAKEMIAHSINDYKQVFALSSNRSWEEMQEFALSFVDITRREMPEVMEEVEGIAEGSGFSLADIMIVNCRYEITKFPKKNECTTGAVLPEAAAYTRSFPRAVSCNMLLAGYKEKQAIDFEVYPNGADEIFPKDGIVTHANHFVVQPKIHALQRTLRDARMRELLMEKHGEIDVDYIKCCMADHVNYPQSLCRHPPIPTQPLMMRSITVSNEIVDFEAGVVHICAGPPCTGDYRTYVL